MDKLQYDSLYKFIVSIGTILIAAPIVGIYQLITGSYDIIISEIEYDNLSNLSLESLENRAYMTRLLSTVFPWVFLVIIIIGILLVLYGCIKWHETQNEIDKQIRLDTKIKQHNIEQLTPAEVLIRKFDELQTDNHLSKVDSPLEIKTRKDPILHAYLIEDKVFNYISKELSQDYTVKQNVRVGNFEYDIVALSNKKHGVDYLYEVKYLREQKSFRLLQKTLERIEIAGQGYAEVTANKFKFKLIIVSNEKDAPALREKWDDFIKKNISVVPPFTEIEFMIEESLIN